MARTFEWTEWYAYGASSASPSALPQQACTLDNPPETGYSPSTGATLYRTLVSVEGSLEYSHVDDSTNKVDARSQRSVNWGGIGPSSLGIRSIPAVQWQLLAYNQEIATQEPIAVGTLAWGPIMPVSHTLNSISDPMWPGSVDDSVTFFHSVGIDHAGVTNSEARRVVTTHGIQLAMRWRFLGPVATLGNGTYYSIASYARIRALFRTP
jgi:hypothetical protein